MVPHRIDVHFVFDRYLLSNGRTDALFASLRDLDPTWARNISLRPSGINSRERISIPFGADSVTAHVTMAVTTRGPAFGRIMDELREGGLQIRDHVRGSTEIRGATKSIVGVVSVDEDPMALTGERLLFNNQVSIQLQGTRIAGRDAIEWAGVAIRQLAKSLRPTWGAAFEVTEWISRVMSKGPSFGAVGVDYARHLPGLFAMNYFGPSYVDLVGRARLLSAPAATVEICGEGVFLSSMSDPATSASAQGQRAHDSILRHLGEEFFFDIRAPDRSTTAPSWRWPRS